jgi:hypothetical protein
MYLSGIFSHSSSHAWKWNGYPRVFPPFQYFSFCLWITSYCISTSCKVYIYRCIYIYMHINIHVQIYMNMDRYIRVFTYECFSFCLWLTSYCISSSCKVDMYICMYICVYIYVYVDIYISILEYVYIYRVYIYMCIYIYKYICIYAYIFTYIWIS